MYVKLKYVLLKVRLQIKVLAVTCTLSAGTFTFPLSGIAKHFMVNTSINEVLTANITVQVAKRLENMTG